MADHDQAVGPRGEEEASRGPDPESAPPPPPGPPQGPPSGPPQDSPVFGPPPPRDSFATYLRQKHTQIIGAGLIGLLIGGLLGGGAVAILFRVADHGDRHRVAHWERPDRYGWQPAPDCWYTPGGGRSCAYPYAYPVQPPMPPMPTVPMPPRTRIPTPVPSPTG